MLLNFYADRGYIHAQINPAIRLSPEDTAAFIDITVQEGPQFTISGIRYKGLIKTKPHVVDRELTFQSGAVIRYSQLLESQCLRALGPDDLQACFVQLLDGCQGPVEKVDQCPELQLCLHRSSALHWTRRQPSLGGPYGAIKDSRSPATS